MNGLGAKVYVIFVDLFLLILSFYVLNSTFSHVTFQTVDLPGVKQGRQVPQEAGLAVVLLASGGLMVDGAQTDVEHLGEVLALSRRGRVDLAVDRSVRWERISHVVKAVAESGKQVCIVYESGS